MRIGKWFIDKSKNQLVDTHTNSVTKLEPRAIEVLLCLSKNIEHVVTREQLIEEVWNGRIISEHAIYRIINHLRNQLDSKNRKKYIVTIPKRGYMLKQVFIEESLHPVEQNLTSNKEQNISDILKADLERQEKNKPSNQSIYLAPWFLPFTLTVIVIGFLIWKYLLAEKIAYSSTLKYENARPIISSKGSIQDLSFVSLSNNLLFSRKDSGDSFNVNLYSSNNKINTQLTKSNLNSFDAKLSSDGQHLVYRDGQPNTDNCNVIYQDLSNTKAHSKSIIDCTDYLNIEFDLSPDGKMLYYTHQDNENKLFRIFSLLISTGKKTQLTNYLQNDAIGDRFVKVSPDGESLLFLRNDQWRETQVGMLKIKDHETKILFEQEGWIWSVDWSNNDEEILYQSTGTEIVKYNLKYNFHKPIFNNLEGEVKSFTHSDHNEILGIALNRSSINVFEYSLNNKLLAENDDKKRSLIIESGFLDFLPNYANQSGRIAFVSNRNGQQQIWLHVDNEEPIQLTDFNDDRVINAISWSPDDKYILSQELNKIYFVNSETGVEEFTFSDSSYTNLTWPSWSSNGKEILFTSDKTGDFQIYKLNIDTKSVTKITTAGGTFSLSEKDNVLYFLKAHEHGLWVKNKDSETQKIIEDADKERFFVIRKHGVYFLPEKSKEIHFFAFLDEKIQNLGITVGDDQWFSISNDENKILVSRSTTFDSVVYLLNPSK